MTGLRARQCSKEILELILAIHEIIQRLETLIARGFRQGNQAALGAIPKLDLIPLNRTDRVIESRHGPAAKPGAR
ncbi:MAG: hypothetical protein QOD12_2002, partial [Verrucomicrobiota bacterium]